MSSVNKRTKPWWLSKPSRAICFYLYSVHSSTYPQIHRGRGQSDVTTGSEAGQGPVTEQGLKKCLLNDVRGGLEVDLETDFYLIPWFARGNEQATCAVGFTGLRAAGSPNPPWRWWWDAFNITSVWFSHCRCSIGKTSWLACSLFRFNTAKLHFNFLYPKWSPSLDFQMLSKDGGPSSSQLQTHPWFLLLLCAKVPGPNVWAISVAWLFSPVLNVSLLNHTIGYTAFSTKTQGLLITGILFPGFWTYPPSSFLFASLLSNALFNHSRL